VNGLVIDQGTFQSASASAAAAPVFAKSRGSPSSACDCFGDHQINWNGPRDTLHDAVAEPASGLIALPELGLQHGLLKFRFSLEARGLDRQVAVNRKWRNCECGVACVEVNRLCADDDDGIPLGADGFKGIRRADRATT
jgi:hypothetical protein